ncbi:hypothetical protein [Sphingopyxis sp. RIFCSPHIGHO2_12_FULL_65_19]|uniref:hypothetical protein n=1 Tax=Sphingopyxis sp. RIFCSPHIGHO2_12_FULL_65_19 TaxID=1802172 RepID=UPI0008ADA26D|nr:hypothetical protein [Sphingopyxis sp. RIFCSPHIGHO2_12_FULL_65_19]OHD07091.1 MAG: hypothetical protein A3E77_15205 [Sphingopyxis sp. RIFCSPHIGHO2_12_FULL_65_19]
MKAALPLLAATLLAGCAATPPPQPQPLPQDAFFAALAARCGKAYAGRLASNQEADADMRGKAMVMHIRHCTADRIEIPFHIDGLGPDGGWDRSRTWVITRTATGLRLKHDHRHADGSKDELTMYGGDTTDAGTATRQAFPVDAESIALFTHTGRNVSNTNIWSVETTATDFTYGLNREGRDFRVTFDYRQPVAPPPAPWGW